MHTVAVIKTGGKQYKIKVGDTVLVEKLIDKKNAIVYFDDILGGKKVKAKIEDNIKGPKKRIMKFKPKTRYTRVMGHRQNLTKIKIEEIK